MKDAIVVGQTTGNKCLIAKFSGATSLWAVDTSFPDITGILRGVYAYSSNDIWVCGGTGILGTTAPILYHYTDGTWTNHSSDITDAVYFHKIAGSASNNVWVVGTATGLITSGAWNWNGTSWTATKTNTISLQSYTGRPGLMRVSVSAEGHAYVPYIEWCAGYEYGAGIINSNVSSATWAYFDNSWVSQAGGWGRIIKAVSDSEIIISNGGTNGWNNYAARRYNGSAWSYVGRLDNGNGTAALLFGALDSTHFIWRNSADGTQHAFKIDASHTINGLDIGDGIIATSVAEPSVTVAVLADDDIWCCDNVCSGTTWASVPELSHWTSGTTWSDSTEYGVDGLSASAWYDVAYLHFTNIPILSNQDPLPDATGVVRDTNISFDITEATVGISLTDTLLYIEGTLAYDGSTDTFQAGYNGPSSSKTVIAGGYRFVIDPTTDFTFAQVVSVRVITKDNVVAPQSTLDETYSFTCVAALLPYLISGPVSPNPGYYLNTHMEWKLGEN